MSLNSLTGRMLLSHVLVAVLTILLTYVVLPVQQALTRGYDMRGYEGVAMTVGTVWMYPTVFDEPIPHYPQTAGFGLVVNPADEVVYAAGDAPCAIGERLAACAPDLVSVDTRTTFERNGTQWTQIVLPTVNNHRVISQRGAYDVNFWEVISATLNPQWLSRTLGQHGLVALILAVPMALIVVWLLLRPKIKRIEHIVNTSKLFAAGDLTARASDRGQDDVHEWALRFDEMADALSQNIIALRELASRNAELVQQVEQSAIQQERLRLSRDLHDSVAQHLFTLTVSTRGLPEMLRKDPDRGISHARTIAHIAQQALLDVRALLVDLRPTDVIQYGLGDAIRRLCEQLENLHKFRIECSVMLFGGHIPAPVQAALYRITREALSNAAKHAKASVVAVSLVQGQKQIILSITDNGQGIDHDTLQAGRMGLHTMRERALALGGEFTIESDRGTTVRVTLPLQGEPHGDTDSVS